MTQHPPAPRVVCIITISLHVQSKGNVHKADVYVVTRATSYKKGSLHQPVVINLCEFTRYVRQRHRLRAFWITGSLLQSWCSGVSSGTGLPDIHWLPPLCPLEVFTHPSAKETKVHCRFMLSLCIHNNAKMIGSGVRRYF